jgi:hypothetical protein
MQNITSAAELKTAIKLLEAEQEICEQQLKAQFRLTYENLKPVNLIKSTIKDIASEPTLMDKLVVDVISLAGEYVSKKIVVSNSGNIFRKLMGSLFEFGVAGFVTKYPEVIRSIGQYISELFTGKTDDSEKS